jgi:hypothetical protein
MLENSHISSDIINNSNQVHSAVLENLAVAQLVKEFPASMKCKSLLLSPQGPATNTYPQPDEFNEHLPTIIP